MQKRSRLQQTRRLVLAKSRMLLTLGLVAVLPLVSAQDEPEESGAAELATVTGDGLVAVASDPPPLQRMEAPLVYEEMVPPTELTLRMSVFANTVPLAYIEEDKDNVEEALFPEFKGFQPDLLRRLPEIAKQLDNVTLHLNVTAAPPYSYGPTFNYVASNCNSTSNPLPYEDCTRYDVLVGDYYVRIFSLSFLSTVNSPTYSANLTFILASPFGALFDNHAPR